mmetsp:Transcript_24989/g.48786  ORF Transcript_24989/g.48786 Transcript_24989/m.48786 type:complete len:734 (+) Transcript_24989:51-2252(+)
MANDGGSWRVDVKAVLGLPVPEARGAETSEWMWGDCGKGKIGIHALARFNPARWSEIKPLPDTIALLRVQDGKDQGRPIVLKVPAGVLSAEQHFATVPEAVAHLERIVAEGLDRVERVTIELVVETARKITKKSTQPFRVYGDKLASIDQRLTLPKPAEGGAMTVKVWRMDNPQRVLIGEASVVEAADQDIEIPVMLDGTPSGAVQLCVTSIGTAPAGLSTIADMGDAMMGFRNQLGVLEPDGKNFLARQPLLSRTQSNSFVGECTVVIDSARGLSSKARKPYLVLHLDGHEFMAESFANPLTFKFGIASLQSDLRIYCYDDRAVDRDAALGRIIIPMVDVIWSVGAAPSFSQVCAAVCRQSNISKTYDAHFMPMSNSGDGRKVAGFKDTFTPALKKKARSGLQRADAFGCVRLSIEVHLGEPAKSQLQCYVASIVSEVRQEKTEPQASSTQGGKKDPKREPSALEVFKKLDLGRIDRAVSRIETYFESPSRGIVCWLQAARWHGFAAGIAWCCFCLFGFFPGRFWAWPLYLWTLLLVNGLLVAQQREKCWSSHENMAFPVWNEDVEPESLEEAVAGLAKDVRHIGRVTTALTSTVERLSNAFTFADGVASICCFACAGIAALLLSLLWLFWDLLDPSGVWSWPLLGFSCCLAISWGRGAAPTQGNTDFEKQEEDPLAPLDAFNRVMNCVPDQADLAHRFISTQVQCLQLGHSLSEESPFNANSEGPNKALSG